MTSNIEENKKVGVKKSSNDKDNWWLVKWKGNWADEINFFASSVMSNDELKAFKKLCRKHSDEACDISYGTNEDDDEMTFKEYLDGCEFIKIKDKATKDFLLKHCDEYCSWSPAYIADTAESID